MNHTADPAELLDQYTSYSYKKKLFIGTITLTLVIIFFYSIAWGAVSIPLVEVIRSLTGGGEKLYSTIIWNIRLPRVLTALIVGVGLSVAGASIQSILRNPLGSPFTLGISHAAAFGAGFSIIVFKAGSQVGFIPTNNTYFTAIIAFLFSLFSTAVIIGIAKFKGVRPETMILTGIAMGSLFTAGLTALQYFASDVELSSIVFWQFGDVGRTVWRDLLLMVIIAVPSTAYFIIKSWDYNVMDSGDETATSLGVNVEKTRLHGMIIASLVTATMVSLVGIIGFVGLVVPHMVRKVIGGDERFLIIASALLGGGLLLISDTAARMVISPIVLPVGIITSFLGVPLFLYLVLRGKEYW